MRARRARRRRRGRPGEPLTSAPAAAAPDDGALAPVVQQVLQGDLVHGRQLQPALGRRLAMPTARRSPTSTATRSVRVRRADVRPGRVRRQLQLGARSTCRPGLASWPPGSTSTPRLSSSVRPIRVRLDGPAEGFEYAELTSAADSGVPKLGETRRLRRCRRRRRCARPCGTSPTTSRRSGPGAYTVADIVFERAGAFLPYASWAIVAAYELDPAADVAAMSPEQQARFAPRSVSWFDGFVVTADSAIEVPVSGFEVPVGQPVFGKTFHLVAHAQHRGADNLLFAGQPLGNNVSPGDPPPPLGVAVGDEPACNTTTRILDDSICCSARRCRRRRPAPRRTSRRVTAGRRRPARASTWTSRGSRRGTSCPARRRHARRCARSGCTPVATGMLAASIDLPAGTGAAP